MAEKILPDGTVVQISRAELSASAAVYFEQRRAVYDLLHEKCGKLFRGDANKATGAVYTGCYHGGWDNLDDSTYSIAAKLLLENGFDFLIRSGDSYMTAHTSREIFPRMKILRCINNKPYGSKPLMSKCYVWQCNETEFSQSWHTP